METRSYYEPILKEKINSIPDILLPDLISMIEIFQRAYNHQKTEVFYSDNYKKNLMSFAGTWNELEDYDEFVKDIYKRRKKYFNKRSDI